MGWRNRMDEEKGGKKEGRGKQKEEKWVESIEMERRREEKKRERRGMESVERGCRVW